jgi:uncharacterized protein
MSQIRFVSLILCCLLFTDFAQAASFDCRKDNLTQLEKMICSDSELSALDKEMSGLFEAEKHNIPDQERQLFFNAQRGWLKQREISCNIRNNTQITGQASDEKKTCLKKLYHARINELKTSDNDEWQAALDELANRFRSAGKKKAKGLIVLNDILQQKKPDVYASNDKPDEETSRTEYLLKKIRKYYNLTEDQVHEISVFIGDYSNASVDFEDIDQDGIKDVILSQSGGKGSCWETEYLFYHGNRNKTLTKMEWPERDLSQELIDFVNLNNKTYIAIERRYIDNPTKQDEIVIELFTLKNEKGRKGIGKVQVNFNSQRKGILTKGNNPAFNILVEKSDAMIKYFARKEAAPLATSLMNNPAWKYDGSNAEKIDKLIGKKYYTSDFQKNDRWYQLLDIDNDGKKEVVCYLVYKTKHKYYNRMIIVKMSDSGPVSYIDVDKRYPELKHIDEKFQDYYCCNDFSGLEESGLKYEPGKGSEYFALSDGKENYIVKIGINQGEKYFDAVSNGYMLGIYKLKNGKIKLIDAMVFDTEYTFKDVNVLK